MKPGTEVRIEWPPVEVAAIGPAIEQVTEAFERLWVAGRLRPLLEAPEGRTALDAFVAARAQAAASWAEAVAAGRPAVALSMSVPTATVRVGLAFARQLLALLSSDETMRSVDAQPLAPTHLLLVESMIAHAEAVLAAGDGSRGIP